MKTLSFSKVIKNNNLVKSYGHPPKKWMEAAKDALRSVARSKKFIMSDDVWDILEKKKLRTFNNRHMGNIFQWAKDQKIIVGTHRFEPTGRPSSHRRPCRIWKSLIA